MKIKLTDDKEHIKKMAAAIFNNDGYCPCRFVKTDDTVCMCKEFEEQTTPGPCHCGLFIKIEDEN